MKYLEDSEFMKFSTSELKEQFLSPDESSVKKVRIARQARSEKSKKLFQICRQGANEVFIASMARWEEQLKELVVLEKHCMALREEVEHLNVKHEVLATSDGGQDEHAEDSTRRLSEAALPGVKRARGAEHKGSVGTRTKEAQVDQMRR